MIAKLQGLKEGCRGLGCALAEHCLALVDLNAALDALNFTAKIKAIVDNETATAKVVSRALGPCAEETEG
jgi:hypothetical protein